MTVEPRRVVRLRSLGRRVADVGICLLFPGGRFVARTLWTVEGFLFPQEGVFLHQLARAAPEGAFVVEIGSMRGLSTCCLASGLRRSKRPATLVAIDPHLYASEPEFRDNLRRMDVASIVDVRIARSEDVAREWKGGVALVFIDGAHDLESAQRDFDDWYPKVSPGGFVLVHDSTELSRFPGPALVAQTRIRVGESFDAVGRVGSITWGRKKGGAPARLPRLPGVGLLDAILRRAKRGRGEPRG